MDKLPAVQVSRGLLFAAAAELFGVPERAIRNFASPRPDAVRARHACAWVVDKLVDGSAVQRGALLGARRPDWFRSAVEHASRYRDEDPEFRLLLDGLLAAVFGLGRLKLCGALAGIDTEAEARRIAVDPLRAIKLAPVTVLAAIVEDHVDTLDLIDLVRAWVLAEDGGGDAGEREALRLAVRDALGLGDEEGADGG